MRGAGLELGGRTVLDGVDLSVGAGERLALVGPSGAGKTSLLHLLAGARLPSRGAVERDGRPLSELTPRELRSIRARTGFVHQDLGLVPILRTHHNVAAGRFGRQGLLGALRALVRPSRDELLAIHAALERVGIGGLLYQRTDRLSGGEAQRAAIARALYQEPEVLLADEPISSVDPARARALLELFLELSAEQGWTLVCSLHDLALARELFPRLVGLREGRVVFDAAPAELATETFEALYRIEDGHDARA